MKFLLIAIGLVCLQDSDATGEEQLRLHRRADEALVAGQFEVSGALFEEALALSPGNPTYLYGLACALARQGKREAAIDRLEEAVAAGFGDRTLALWDEDLAGVREHTRFEGLANAMLGNGEELTASCQLHQVIARKESRPGPAAIDPTGTRIAAATTSGRLILLEVEDGDLVRELGQFEEPLWNLAFSPSGKRLATVDHLGHVELIDATTGELIFAADEFPPGGEYRYPFGSWVEFDSNETRLAVGLDRRGAALWDLEGKLIKRIERPLGNFFAVHACWSADGRFIATLEGNQVVLLDGATGERDRVIPLPGKPTSVALSPDGQRIAVGLLGHARALVLDFGSGEVTHELETKDIFLDEERYVPMIGFSPDSTKVAFSSATGVVVTVEDLEEKETLYSSEFLGGRMGETVQVRWSPDGSRIWYAYTTGLRWQQLDLRSGEIIAAPCTRIPSLSRSGRAVAVTRGGVACFDANTGDFFWHRVELGEEESLLQAPSGHVRGEFESLEGCVLYWQERASKHDAAHPRAVDAFDPKRVRAALAGVPLLPR